MADLYKRNATLELTDEEVQQLTEIAARSNMTAGELLSAFVHDLCRSEWSNGSDERDRAEDWYDRARVGFPCDQSLAGSLVTDDGLGAIESLVDALDSQQMYREDPKAWKEELEEVAGNEAELEFSHEIDRALEKLPQGSNQEEQIQRCCQIVEEFLLMNEKGEKVN